MMSVSQLRDERTFILPVCPKENFAGALSNSDRWVRFSVCPLRVSQDAKKGCKKELCSGKRTLLVLLCAQLCYTALLETLPAKL